MKRSPQIIAGNRRRPCHRNPPGQRGWDPCGPCNRNSHTKLLAQDGLEWGPTNPPIPLKAKSSSLQVWVTSVWNATGRTGSAPMRLAHASAKAGT
eukprot:2799331-Prorocentrum_lima.AAC.1